MEVLYLPVSLSIRGFAHNYKSEVLISLKGYDSFTKNNESVITVMTNQYTIQGDTIPLHDLRELWTGSQNLKLGEDRVELIAASARSVAGKIESGERMYGVNTGYGSLSTTTIAGDQMLELQRRVVLSCATGTGKPFEDATVRLAMLLKINSLSMGLSGVRQDLVDALITLFNAAAYPVVPSQGSVGASGDLAPLGHLSCALLGIGSIRIQGEIVPAEEGLRRVGLSPIQFHLKEGLAMLNGTQFSTALALEGLFATEKLYAAAVSTGALTLEAARGSHTPFDARIHAARRQQGQIKTAKVFRHLFEGGEDRQTYAGKQDPYSLRCQPQILGACLDNITHAAGILESEANAVTDNPINIASDEVMLSGGNFHAEPVAMAADILALAIAEIGALSERRIAYLVDANMSGLPAFLVIDGGVNCGFMTVHIAAASLASENKSMAHPASVDSIPTTANQEDHVSMATFGARRLKPMAENTEGVLAIEILCAAQAADIQNILNGEQDLPPRVQPIMDGVRQRVDYLIEDRPIAPDIEHMRDWMQSDDFRVFMVEGALPSA
jgi:histidine ammonia-lyase